MFPIFFIIKLVILAAGGVVAYAGYRNWSWLNMVVVPKQVTKTLGKDMTRFAMMGVGVLIMLFAVWLIL